jgi:hypothetical protein
VPPVEVRAFSRSRRVREVRTHGGLHGAAPSCAENRLGSLLGQEELEVFAGQCPHERGVGG